MRNTSKQSHNSDRALCAKPNARTKAEQETRRAQVRGESCDKTDPKSARPGVAAAAGAGEVGMGGSAQRAAVGRPPRVGPLTQRPRPQIGSRVRNASGRGVWGFGVVEAVIPVGVAPWWFCMRRGIAQLFRRATPASVRERYVVRGDDGRLHTPERVVWPVS